MTNRLHIIILKTEITRFLDWPLTIQWVEQHSNGWISAHQSPKTHHAGGTPGHHSEVKRSKTKHGADAAAHAAAGARDVMGQQPMQQQRPTLSTFTAADYQKLITATAPAFDQKNSGKNRCWRQNLKEMRSYRCVVDEKRLRDYLEEDAQKKKDVQGELKDQEIALRKNIERICRRIRRTTFFWGSRSRSRQQQSTRWKLSTRTSGSGEGGWAVAIRLHPGPQQQQRVEEGDQGECAQEG